MAASAQVDIWSLGVCIYQWTFGQLPFTGKTTAEVFDSICSQALALPVDAACSAPLADFITLVRLSDPVAPLGLDRGHPPIPCVHVNIHL